MDIVNIFINFTTLQYIELVSVILSLTFLILLIKENKWCWIFGIASSVLGVYLMYQFKLYSEAVLYSIYILIGFYGWYVWISNSNDHKDNTEQSNKIENKKLQVTAWSWTKHLPILIGGALSSFLLGLFFLTQTDAERTYVDATTTIFSVIASYMEAHKIFSSWIFWIIINGVSIWLYYDRGLMMYAGMMVIYFGVSLFGFWDWGRKSGVLG